MVVKFLFVVVNIFSIWGTGCNNKPSSEQIIYEDTNSSGVRKADSPIALDKLITRDSIPLVRINVSKLNPDSLISFARSLLGTPYMFASIDPLVGFDCSGFITYVFNHFKVKVPRSSKDFENVGTEITIKQCRKGDLILFTGTDSTIRHIGHMGIIVANEGDSIKFIHSSSGKAHGVVISELRNYYMSRYVKVIRIFN